MLQNTEGHFKRTRVNIDGQRFEGCFFDNCVIVYSATGPYHLSGCTFVECSFSFEGAAAATVQFMTHLYAVAPQMIEATFDKIRLGV